MRECLRCGKECETGLFCNLCQASLVQRSWQEERALCSSQVPQVHVTELSPQATLLAQDAPDPAPHTQWYLQTDQQHGPQTMLHLQRPSEKRTQALLDNLSFEQTGPEAVVLQARQARLRRLRRIFIGLVLLAVIALIIDSILVSVVFTRRQERMQAIRPLLTMTPGVVYPGQLALLKLDHFHPLARVILRRNVDESLRIDAGKDSLLRVNAQGMAEVHVLVEDNWGSGNHVIEAEDVDAHYVASVSVQVIGAGPIQPAHLQLSQDTINLGADWQGANTVQPVTLQNTGGGRVTWTSWSNQPWLMLTPTQGTFSKSQRVAIAATRERLKPGDYEGLITFVSSTGTKIPLHVKMTVLAAQAEARAMLVITPPALSFMAIDGDMDPQEQSLTISNPGSRPLHWSFREGTPTVSVDQDVSLVDKMDWLTVVPQTGALDPGQTVAIQVRVHSRPLLPDIYSGILTFNGAQNALNNPQPVAVSLLVQPQCGITTNTGTLSFTALAGQQVPAQTLMLGMAPSCSQTLSWRASSQAKWLTITPNDGKVSVQKSSLTTVSVNSEGLAPGNYTGMLVVLSERRTQTILVQFSVLSSEQPPPDVGNVDIPSIGTTTSGDDVGPTAAPSLALSSLNVSFSVVQGDGSSPGQAVSLANTGGGMLYWQAREDAAGQSWLKISPQTGTVPAGQTRDITLNVNSGSLDPGTYRSSVVVTATDGAGVSVDGSPQMLVVTLKVMQPCTLSVHPTRLSFSTSLLSGEPDPQIITLQGIGDCARPITWNATVDAHSQSWLHLSATTGSDTGNGGTLSVHVSTNGSLLGVNRGQITFSASDDAGAALRNSSQTVTVTFTILG